MGQIPPASMRCASAFSPIPSSRAIAWRSFEMRIAIDMDEVMADTHAAKLALFAARGYTWSEEEIAGRHLSDLAGSEDAAQVESEMQRGLFFADLAVVQGAQEGIAALAQDHEIFVATAAMEYPASCPHKIAWLARHFPDISPMNIVLCGDKSVIAADLLIDDSPRHFTGFGGTGICFDAPHNRGDQVSHRLTNWADAEAMVSGFA
ncbi:5' nucleotidase, NT5C type [Palleronia sp. LCG004]|uniref:5' nucleotidase, NT5C type n=1 Tax=Palleronia sp. LCG004 TaxID=3079304 RepID=UPI002942EE26|nr:hypothetical protein [Palleronia sp. LCG004]WOI55100.1 hypothetical protein RVY76_08495 [Palleronia sp. LCG004]